MIRAVLKDGRKVTIKTEKTPEAFLLQIQGMEVGWIAATDGAMIRFAEVVALEPVDP